MRIKNKFILIVFLSLVFIFSSCNTSIYIEGIDNYSPANSSTGISKTLIPTQDFIKKFQYIDANYYYYDTGVWADSVVERELMYLEYNETEYQKAKEFTYSNVLVDKNVQFYGKGFDFFINLSEYDTSIENIESSYKFPYRFNMIAHNDEKKTLVFIGFNCDIEKDYEVYGLTNGQFEVFLDRHFSFYEF